jgi:hypothetical protein
VQDITWMQKVISERLTEKARSDPDPWVRLYARLAVAGVPGGGGAGSGCLGRLVQARDAGLRACPHLS